MRDDRPARGRRAPCCCGSRGCPGDATAVARAVAVLGESATLPAVAALAGLDEAARRRDATGALARAEILRPEPPLGFVHPLVRDAVYRELPPASASSQHARAARRAARRRRAARAGRRPPARTRRAARRRRGWPSCCARPAAPRCPRRARQRASRYLRRALDEPPPRRAARRSCCSSSGSPRSLTDGRAAIEHLREAYDALDGPGRRACEAAPRARAARCCSPGRRGGVAIARRARRATLPPDLEDDLRALEAFELMLGSFGARQRRERLRRLERRTASARATASATKMLARVAALEWAHTGGHADECAALALARWPAASCSWRDNGLLMLAAIADARPRATGPRRRWRLGRSRCPRRTAAARCSRVSPIHLWRGFTLLPARRAGGGGGRSLRHGRRSSTRGGTARSRSRVHDARSSPRRRRARRPRRGARVAGRGPPRRDEQLRRRRYWRAARLELLLAEGRSAEALEAFAELRQRYHAHVRRADGAWRPLERARWRSTGSAARDEALALADEELAAPARWGAPGDGRPVAAGARHVCARGRTADAARRRSRVLEARPRGSSSPRRSPRSAPRCAAPRRPDRRARAAAPRARARRRVRRRRRWSSTSAPSSTPPARARARGAAAASTRSPRASAAWPRSPPTARRNRDIAQALFVTPKTVEVHLSNAYRKLGIRSRRELAGALPKSGDDV